MNCNVMVDPASVPGDHVVFVAGNDDDAQGPKVVALLEQIGWPEPRIIDLGDLTAARATEMYVMLWVRLMRRGRQARTSTSRCLRCRGDRSSAGALSLVRVRGQPGRRARRAPCSCATASSPARAVRPTVLTFGAAPDYDGGARAARARLLSDEVALLNIYDHYREHGWGDATPGELEDLSAQGRRGRRHSVADRLPHARGPRRLRLPARRRDAVPAHPGVRRRRAARRGARRSSGSGRTARRSASSARSASGSGAGSASWPRARARLRVHRLALRGAPHRAAAQPPAPPPLPDAQHAPGAPRRWDSTLHPVYRRVLARIDDMDAMVTLTERQRDDIAERRGRTSNMFVVPNPVDVPRAARRCPRATRTGSYDGAARDAEAPHATRSRRSHAWSRPSRGAARHLRRGQPAPGSARDRARGADRVDHAARLRPARPRRAVDVERVPDDERVRGLPAVDAREHEPRLPGGQLRHQVRPTRADHRRRRRLRRAGGRRGRARRPRDRAAALAGAGAADERRGAREGRALRDGGVRRALGRVLRAVVEHKPARTRIEHVDFELDAPARSGRSAPGGASCPAARARVLLASRAAARSPRPRRRPGRCAVHETGRRGHRAAARAATRVEGGRRRPARLDEALPAQAAARPAAAADVAQLGLGDRGRGAHDDGELSLVGPDGWFSSPARHARAPASAPAARLDPVGPVEQPGSRRRPRRDRPPSARDLGAVGPTR